MASKWTYAIITLIIFPLVVIFISQAQFPNPIPIAQTASRQVCPSNIYPENDGWDFHITLRNMADSGKIFSYISSDDMLIKEDRKLSEFSNTITSIWVIEANKDTSFEFKLKPKDNSLTNFSISVLYGYNWQGINRNKGQLCCNYKKTSSTIYFELISEKC